jgi:hypothetical protein
MTITNVTQASGFNQAQYDALIQKASAQKVDPKLVDAQLLAALNAGSNFTDAVNSTQSGLPRLAQPNAQAVSQLANWTALPSPGALVMNIISKQAAEQRQQNKETQWAQTEAIAQSMQDEAGKMREMATKQLVLSMIGAAVTVAGGLAQAEMANFSGAADAQATLQNTQATGVGQAVGGAGGLFSAISQYVGTMGQAEFKEMEADQERMRALRDSLKSLDDSLTELIQKSLSSADAIQQSMNQARAKILG